MKAGWNTVKLGVACKIVNGATPSTSIEANWGGPHCWITPAEMGGLSDPYVGETRRTLTDVGLADCSASLLPAGSVILSSRAPIGHVIINTVPMATNQGCKSMIPRSDLDAKFLFYFIKANVPLLESLGTGATFKELSGGKLASVEIPLPPLAEQKRIVALLDEAFAGIDEAKAKAENTMKGYDVLSRGITDRLVFPVDAIHPIKALGQVVEIARGGSPRPIQNYFTDAPDGINWIKISDATASGKYIYKTVQKIKPSGLKKTRMVKPGDFLLSNSMSFGRPYIMKTSGCIHDGWLVLSGVERELDQDYLYHVLGTNSVYAQFDRLAAGSTVRNLNSESASKVLIPVPPISLQKEIAEKLDHAQEVIAAAQQLTSKKHEALISLRASILSQAFAGELTA